VLNDLKDIIGQPPKL